MANQDVQAGTHSGGGSMARFRERLTHLDWTGLNLGIVFCACIELIEAAIQCPAPVVCDSLKGYQIAVGAISAILGLISAFLGYRNMLSVGKQEFLSAFQFLWWIAGAVTNTFFGGNNFVSPGNGYFGSWGALIFATFALSSVSPRFQSSLDQGTQAARKPLILLVLASAVVIGASIDHCEPSSQCTSFNAFAVALGTISLVISFILLIFAPMVSPRTLRFLAYFLLLWWMVGAAVVTFPTNAPFVEAGNGYFASFVGVFASGSFVLTMVQDSN